MPEFIADTFTAALGAVTVTIDYEDMTDGMLVSMIAGGDTEASAVLVARNQEGMP